MSTAKMNVDENTLIKMYHKFCQNANKLVKILNAMKSYDFDSLSFEFLHDNLIDLHEMLLSMFL